MEKKYCDTCGKEIKEWGTTFYGSKWCFWGFISKRISGDFCSIECLIKFLKKEKLFK